MPPVFSIPLYIQGKPVFPSRPVTGLLNMLIPAQNMIRYLFPARFATDKMTLFLKYLHVDRLSASWYFPAIDRVNAAGKMLSLPPPINSNGAWGCLKLMLE